MRQIRKPIADDVAPTPYVKLQQSGDEATAHGQKYYIKGGFVQKTSAALIDVDHGDDCRCQPAGGAGRVSMPQGGGAIKRVKPDGHGIRAARHPVQLVRARGAGTTRR